MTSKPRASGSRAASTAALATAKSQITAYNNKDWDAVRSVLSSSCVYDEVGTERKLSGHDAILEVWRSWASAFPDSKGTFNRASQSGNTVVLEVTWRGTHRGTLQSPGGPIAPTGRAIAIRACQVVEVAGGKVRSVRHYFDMGTLMRQLGLA